VTEDGAHGLSSRTLIVAAKLLRPAGSAPLVMSAIELEPGDVLSGANWRTGVPTRTAMTISHDGSFLVYSAENDHGGHSRLFLRRMNQLHATALPDTEGGR
jgi:hypothetical protein